MSHKTQERKGLWNLMAKALREPEKIPQAARTELYTLGVLSRHRMPDVLLQFLGGIGDELLLTCVARELKRREPAIRIWQVSHSPTLLENNPYYQKIFGWDHMPLRYSNLLNGRRVRLAYSEQVIPGEVERPPGRHIIAELCMRAGIRGTIEIRPYLFLEDEEIEAGRLAEQQITIHCVGESSYENVMRNKIWPRERYDQFIALIRESSDLGRAVAIVQVGTPSDPPLAGAIDMRGKTNLRQTAAILKNSEAFIGTSGLLSHMARAVDCRSVIIYGGREHSHQTGYVCNENLDSFVDCAPCWRWNTCDFERKCMTMIKPAMVLTSLQRVLKNKGTELETEIAII